MVAGGLVVRHAHSQPSWSRQRRIGSGTCHPATDDQRSGPDLPVAVVRLDPGLPLPSYAHPGDAGADLMTTVDLTLGARRAGPGPDRDRPRPARGVRRAGPPRSGLAARHGLSIVNTPGTIDAGYRGEIKVLLVNHDRTQPVELRRGDRIAQLVVQRFERAVFTEVDALPESVRGAGGYGSTGVESPAPGA